MRIVADLFDMTKPQPATESDTALTASTGFLASMGPGILEKYLMDSEFLLVTSIAGTTYRIPVSCLRIPFTPDLMTALLNSTPKPTSLSAAALAEQDREEDEVDYSDMPSLISPSDSDTTSPSTSPLPPASFSATYTAAPCTVPSRIVMHYPAVYTLPHNDPANSVSMVNPFTRTVLCCPRSIVDTGSNMIIIPITLARVLGLSWTKEHVMHTATSSGTVTPTLGKVTTPVDLVICHGTPDEMSVRLPIHIMGGNHTTFELLLGSPFINGVGADLLSLRSSLIYRPYLQSHGDATTTAGIRMYTTTSNPSANYVADLNNPTPSVEDG